jgi:hypothetical protein
LTDPRSPDALETPLDLEVAGATPAPRAFATGFAPSWLDPADVRKWLRDTGTPPVSDDVEVDRVARMTEVYVEGCRPEWWTVADPDAVPPVESTYVPDAETYQGAVMYAARELRRRNSPAGVETYGDVGLTFVSKYDPDIERALRTGAYLRPGVG